MLTDLQTLIVGYVLYSICFILIGVRLAGTWARSKRWATEDYWIWVALVTLAVRVAVIHMVLMYGTNNVQNPQLLTQNELNRRAFGSKMALAGRTCYAIFIWSLKFCILALYAKIVGQLHEYERFIKWIWTFFMLTFVGAIVSTYVECRPVSNYWQVYPAPGHECTASEAQVYTTGSLNIITDLILIIYPIPIVFRTRLPFRQKLELYSLFSLGFIVILVSTLRLPVVVDNHAIQAWRTLFASIEMVAACGVANAPFLYRLVMDRSKKIHSSVQTGSSGHDTGGFCFSVNRSSRRTRQAIENEDIEFTGLREATVVGIDSGKNLSIVDEGAWGADGYQSQEEEGREWGTDTATVADSDRVEGIEGRGGSSHEPEQRQPVDRPGSK